jgi:hypothetical protein
VRYLYIKTNVEKVWGVRYTLDASYLYIKRNVEKVWGARYLSKNTVCFEVMVFAFTATGTFP